MAYEPLVRITNRFMRVTSCDFCTIPLSLSIWRGEVAVFSKSANMSCGFLCVKCAMRRTRNGSLRATEKDFDDFVFEIKGLNKSRDSMEYDNAWF